METASFKSSGKDIISTGSIHSFTSDNLEITLLGLTFIFEFLTDKEGKQRLEKESLSTKVLKLKIFNFNNPLGTGTTKPIEMGTINNRKLYLAFTVYALDKDSLKLFQYTFFMGENVNGRRS